MRVARGAGTPRRVFLPVRRRMRDEPAGGGPCAARGERPAAPVLTETGGPRIFLPVTTMKPPSGPGRGRTVSLVLAAWLLALGFDFFLHGGLLARFYVRDTPFLLPPETAFARIPAGYLAFLLLTGGLLWLFRRLDVRGAGDGGRMGLAVGLFLWGTLALGLWSITTAAADLLIGWWVGQGVELALAGAVLGAGRADTSLGRLWGRVVVAVVLLLAATVALQNLGWAPAVPS